MRTTFKQFQKKKMISEKHLPKRVYFGRVQTSVHNYTPCTAIFISFESQGMRLLKFSLKFHMKIYIYV